ncbi:MAG: WG repeat-containing protein [Bacteroidia bacterium]
MNQHIDFLPFESFLELLQEHGFAVGVSEHVRLRQLLDALPKGTEQDRLRTAMAPLFARSPQDQRLFYRLFDYHFGQMVPQDVSLKPNPVAPVESKDKSRPWIFPRLGRGVFALLGLLVAGLLGWLVWNSFLAYRQAPNYLRSYYLPSTVSNKISYTARRVLGMEELCEGLDADFAYQGELGELERWEVQFDNRSAGPVKTYLWDFGGTGQSQEANPVTKLPPGDITVCLDVEGNRGCRRVSCKNIRLGPDSRANDGDVAPEAFFAWTQVPGETKVEFQDSSIVGKRENVKFRWLFGDGKEGFGKTIEHKYPSFGNYTVRLQLVSEGDVPLARSSVRIRVIDPDQQAIPEATLSKLHPPDIADLYCSGWQRYATPIKWMLFFAILSGLASFVLYRENKKMVARRSPRPSKGPYSFKLQAPSEITLYDQNVLRETARQLRRRRENEDAVFDIPATVEATIVDGGYPRFKYRSGSQPAEYLVLIDRVCNRDHQARLFHYITEVLMREDILLDVYHYQRNPDLFWRKVESPPITSGELAALYPNHRLIVLGDAQHFIDAVSGDLTEHAFELLNWEERAILSPASTADWGYREAKLASHFRFMPATILALRDLVEQFRKDEPRPLRSWLRPSDKSTPLQEDDPHPKATEQVAILERYLGEDAFNLVACTSLYPELHWELTMHIGQKLIAAGIADESLLSEESLMRFCRLSIFRKGMLSDRLRIKLAESLSPETEAIAREAILEVIELADPPESSVASYQHKKQWTLQQWELRKAKGKLRRQVSVNLEDMLRRNEVQDPVALHYLQTRKTGPLDFLMPESMRKVLYPKGISMLGAKARLVGLLAIPLLALLALYDPPSPQQISLAPDGNYVCLPNAADSARYLDHLGCLSYINGENDPQSFVKAFNYFNDAAGRTSLPSEAARIRYHRGLAALQVFRADGRRDNLRRSREDFRQAVMIHPHIFLKDNIQQKTLRKNQEALPSTFEQIRPDGQSVLRVKEGGASLGTLDATYRSVIINDVQYSGFATLPLEAWASVRNKTEFAVWDYRGRLQNRLPAGLHQEQIRAFSFSPLGTLVALGSDDRSATIWDLNENSRLQSLTEHRAAVLGVAFSPDEELLVTVGADGVGIVTEVQTEIRVAVLVGHRGPIHSVDVHPLGGIIATAGNDSTLRLWDMTGVQLSEVVFKHGITSAVFAHTGDFLMTVNGKGQIEARDVAGRYIRTLQPEQKAGEPAPTRKGFRSLSQTTSSMDWLASFEKEGILLSIEHDHSQDSLSSDALYAFCLAAYTDRRFDLAIARLSNLIALHPERDDAILLRGLSYLFHPTYKSSRKQLFIERGLIDIEQAQRMNENLLAATKPSQWLGALADGSPDTLRDRLCALWPEACTEELEDPIIPTPVQEPEPSVLDSVTSPEELAKYEESFDFIDGLAAVRQRGKWGFIDKSGQEIIAPQYDAIISRPQSMSVIACVRADGKAFCIDREGNCQDYQQYRCESSLPADMINTLPTLVPKKITSQPQVKIIGGYIMSGPYSEGLAPIRKGDLFGYVNEVQQVVIPVEFTQAGQFYNGRARVEQNGKSFFIDRTGTCVEVAGSPCP